MPLRALVLLVLRLGLGGLFVAAGVLKTRDPAGFAQEIANYDFLPALAPYLSAALPTTEVVAGLALIILPATWRRAAAVTVAGMLGVFTVAALSVLARGVNVDCGCFGTVSGPVTWLTVLRNLALLGTVAAVVALDRKPRTGVGGARISVPNSRA
jgi:putative oxidoreductase